MKTTEYARMAEQESTYWWHIGRLRIIDTYVSLAQRKKHQPKILNVGCGTGGTIDMLEKHGPTDNVDVSEDAIRFVKKLGHKKVRKVNGIELPFKDKTYDLVCAFDVLEHIDRDKDALKEWARVLRDDGAVVITVPAYQWLWTEHDVSLHHKRRYTRQRLTSAAKAAGLEPKKTSYAIVFSLPLVVGFRFLNKVLNRKTDSETSYVKVPQLINSIFSNLLYGEAKLHKVMSFPAGTSVVAIFQKTEP
jgi:SAM-dependent methyltransferase